MEPDPVQQEKTAVGTVYTSEKVSDRDTSDDESLPWDKKSTAKLLRKLDWNIIPFMSLVYLFVSDSRSSIDSVESYTNNN